MTARIYESSKAIKDLKYAPKQIVKSYEVWARLVEEHGHLILNDFPGYRDEKLLGRWENHRSSRLNRKWRVIYRVNTQEKFEVVSVERVTAHDYRRR